MTDAISPGFNHPENITVGVARVIYGTNGYSWAQENGWFLPGGRFTKNRDDAVAAARSMNRLMGGVEVSV